MGVGWGGVGSNSVGWGGVRSSGVGWGGLLLVWSLGLRGGGLAWTGGTARRGGQLHCILTVGLR